MVTRIESQAEPEELEIEATEESDDEQVALGYEITSYPADYTLRVLNDQLTAGDLVLPYFQRAYVWSQAQASRLIESFLLGLPVPEVFLYKERASEKRRIVDGHQRLATILYYYRGRLEGDRAFRLRGVDERWEGKLYSELEERDRLRLDNSTLRSIVIQQLDPDDDSSIYLVFERLNTGGTQLNPMEIRRAQFSEHTYAFLDDLNSNADWRELIGIPKPHRRLRDVELVLRVLAMSSERDSYKKPLKLFLNGYMRMIQDMDSKSRLEAQESFEYTCSAARESLGSKPFHVNGPLNVAALDSVLGVLASERSASGSDLKNRYDRLLEDDAFRSAIERSTSDEDSVERRFRRAIEMLTT